ncbi:MAG: hypothetical protein RR235_08880 [Oscillospiraceae bacterium]
MKSKTQKSVTLEGGAHAVINEDGKYYYCEGGLTVRKLREGIEVLETPAFEKQDTSDNGEELKKNALSR